MRNVRMYWLLAALVMLAGADGAEATCSNFDDLDEVLAQAEIDNQGVRASLQALAANIRRQSGSAQEAGAGNMLGALLSLVDAQDGQHVANASAQEIRNCISDLAGASGRAAFRMHFNSDGTLNGMNVTDPEGSLFMITDGDVLGSTKAWIVENADLFGPPTIRDVSVLEELQQGNRPPASVFDTLTVHRFSQTYRGHEVLGPQSSVAVTVTNDARAISFTGSVLNPRIPYSGLDGPLLSEAEAKTAILLAWMERDLSGEPTLGDVRLVAVPARRSIGYLADVLMDGQAVARVVVSVVTGEVFLFEDHRAFDAFDHREISVWGYLQDEPEGTLLHEFHDLPGSTFGMSCGPGPPTPGCQVRMGDDRAAVYDLRGDHNVAPTVYTENAYFADGSVDATFDNMNVSGFRFKTQYVFVRLQQALRVLDFRVSRSGSGWDHDPDPDIPFTLFQEPPLTVWTNADTSPSSGEADLCENHNAVMRTWNFSNYASVEHPYTSPNYTTALMVLCHPSQDDSYLFHELGHYYDLYAEYGIMGNGLTSGTCILDTSDEAIPLRETIADITALFLFDQIYSQIGYTLRNAPASTPCKFSMFGLPPSWVHGNPCTPGDDYVDSYYENQPTPNLNAPCALNQGYNMRAIYQAFWEFINGALCDASAPYDCAYAAGGDEGDFARPGMDAILYAERLSNIQGYRQFFSNMGVFLLFEHGQQIYDRYRSTMLHHDVLRP